jgi:hypothetical protein
MGEIFNFSEYLRKIGKDVILEENNNSNGDGDGGGVNMEARVAKLESSVEHIQTNISDIKADIKDINKELTAIKVGIPKQTLTIIAAMTGIMTLLLGITGTIIASVLKTS